MGSILALRFDRQETAEYLTSDLAYVSRSLQGTCPTYDAGCFRAKSTHKDFCRDKISSQAEITFTIFITTESKDIISDYYILNCHINIINGGLKKLLNTDFFIYNIF